MMRRLIIGAGYIGQPVAEHWLQTGDQVTVLTRSETRASEFRERGFEAVVGDVLDPAAVANFPNVDTVLYAVGFDRSSGTNKREVYVDGLRHVLGQNRDRFGHTIYVSSTSVYHQENGEVVDEESPTRPTTESGRICLDAESAAQDLLPTGRLSILRFAGIYGPNRLIGRAEQLRKQVPMAGTGEEMLNLIHRDDAVSTILAVAKEPADLLLVSDAEPVRRADFYGKFARLVDVPEPTFDSSPRAGRPISNRRCNSARLRERTLPRMAYPTYCEGLPASLHASD